MKKSFHPPFNDRCIVDRHGDRHSHGNAQKSSSDQHLLP